VNEATPQFDKIVDEISVVMRYGLKVKTQFFSFGSSPASAATFWPYVVQFTSKGTVSMLDKQYENVQQRERAWVTMAVTDNALVGYLESFKAEPEETKFVLS
jgi:hypothetical protein